MKIKTLRRMLSFTFGILFSIDDNHKNHKRFSMRDQLLLVRLVSIQYNFWFLYNKLFSE